MSGKVTRGKMADPNSEREYRRMVSIWIREDTIERVEQVAWRLHDSRSHMIARILEEHVGDYEEHEETHEEGSTEETE